MSHKMHIIIQETVEANHSWVGRVTLKHRIMKYGYRIPVGY
jgi:hypothetical protein